MNAFAQKLCIHLTGLFVVLVGGGFAVAGWIPPFSPDGSFEEMAKNFHDQDNVRVAAAMFFFGGAAFVFPTCAIAAQLRRIEGSARPVMTWAQLLSGAIGVLGIQIPAAIWLAISYYDGTDPDIATTLNAMAWFFLLGAVAPAVFQNFAIAAVVLSGDGTVYSRWVGYVNLYCALGLMLGVLTPFFKDGPFAWNGVVGFWIVAVDFFIWVFVMWITTLQAINADTGEAEGAADGRRVAVHA
ncbi:hypothetical protein [Sporichthya sp.]|uniref:hypothetical protein n=1 Tax=Sporichthya sp. TaxID=65475 RepID=UPI00180153B2|nr:hypothetical protein [Sporichthya sp.]MBA3743071.1 hypothetical protein [Sporichthya sp.]